MSRTLPAMLALALAACSSGGPSSTSNNSGTPGPTGTANSASTGASSATGTGGTTGAASTGGGSTSGGGLTAESYNQMFNSAYCNAVLRCESAAPYILTLCDQLELLDLSDLPLAVDAGRIAFDPASAAACVAALPNVRDCESVIEQGLPAPCNQAIVGQVPAINPATARPTARAAPARETPPSPAPPEPAPGWSGLARAAIAWTAGCAIPRRA